MPITLRIAGKKVQVHGRAVWIKRAGLRRHEVGFNFVNIKPALASAIQSLIELGFIPADEPDTANDDSPAITATVQVPDYFGVLGLEPDADDAAIRRAYHEQAKQYHPDHCDADNAAKRFQEIQEAYQALRDPDRRKVIREAIQRAA